VKVRLSWVERFLNFFPSGTKLYLRGERGKDEGARAKLYEELVEAMAPFFEKLREEAFEDGRAGGFRISASPFKDPEPEDRSMPYDYRVRLHITDAAGNAVGFFESMHRMRRHEDAEALAAKINGTRL